MSARERAGPLCSRAPPVPLPFPLHAGKFCRGNVHFSSSPILTCTCSTQPERLGPPGSFCRICVAKTVSKCSWSPSRLATVSGSPCRMPLRELNQSGLHPCLPLPPSALTLTVPFIQSFLHSTNLYLVPPILDPVLECWDGWKMRQIRSLLSWTIKK